MLQSIIPIVEEASFQTYYPVITMKSHIGYLVLWRTEKQKPSNNGNQCTWEGFKNLGSVSLGTNISCQDLWIMFLTLRSKGFPSSHCIPLEWHCMVYPTKKLNLTHYTFFFSSPKADTTQSFPRASEGHPLPPRTINIHTSGYMVCSPLGTICTSTREPWTHCGILLSHAISCQWAMCRGASYISFCLPWAGHSRCYNLQSSSPQIVFFFPPVISGVN